MVLFRLILAAAVFAFTLILVIIKPWKLDIGYSALIGALVSILVGISTPEDILKVWDIIWNPTFTFVAIIIMSLVFDYSGFFEYYAIKISKLAGGNGLKLFVFIVLLGAAISAFFANDGTALVLTPIVSAITARTGMDRKRATAFIMATGFIADSSSLPFIISNLVNIIGAGYFGVSFAQYAETMIIPDAVSVLASLAMLLIIYRKEASVRYSPADVGDEDKVITDRQIFRLAFPFIILVVIAYFVSSFDSVPVSFIALPAALILLYMARVNGKINTNLVLKEAPWQIVLFSLGMYVVVYGFGNAGLTSLLTDLMRSAMYLGNPAYTVIGGLFFGFLAGAMNNLPSTMMGVLTVSNLNGNRFLMYANVIGNDIGPKFTPIGSLATLLWMYTLKRKHGIEITPAYYMKIGFIAALPVLVLTLISLYAVVSIGL
ncbi:arsenic transporter [Thermoplasma sp.]|uniref:arsenic transporter n=1 Tax=Thermoplasma sp. TaxID=1973142 RepID=UPI00127E26CE|nr:arsenic transporter [Thermoplasma sp.]KAA8922683.1 MAG: arsenic transporter [Thermoplasma sp.]